MSQSLKIAFAGTPAIAASILGRILDSGFMVETVLTQPDRPSGRGHAVTQSAVKKLALSRQIPVLQPISLKQDIDTSRILEQYQLDVMVVVAYGLIVPPHVLSIPRYGCVNIHMSLLPLHRGAAPIERAVIAGDATTGVTIMQMDQGLDSGDILLQQSVNIEVCDTTGSVAHKLTDLGTTLIVEYLHKLHHNETINKTPQPLAGISYAHKITKAEARINWHEPADIIARKIRGFNPNPGCFTQLNDTLLKVWCAQIWQRDHVLTTTIQPGNLTCTTPGTIIATSPENGIIVCCGNNTYLTISELQLAGKNRQSVIEFVHGHPNLLGTTLG